ncbi:MAG: amidohydrolase family protein, partial [Solirubrobacterales bacterium]
MSLSALAVVGATDPSGRSVGLVAEDGRITGFGPDATPPEGALVLDGSGMLIAPPLVNGHTHAAMTLFRGRGDDLPLMRWLKEAIWPLEQNLTPDDVYWGARLACVEMARNGVSTFWDMYWQEPEVARAVEDAGLRATVGPVVIDPPGGSGPSTGWLEDLDRCASVG